MTRVLLAGATGSLGRLVAAALVRRGHDVAALVRPESAAVALPDGVSRRVGSPADVASLSSAFGGIEVLVSCLGASTLPDPRKGWKGFDAVDLPLNRNLVDAARAAGVRKVVYVSVAGAERNRDLVYFDAHERVVDHLATSGLAYTVIRPTGFFSAVSEYLELARRGFVPLFGDGTAMSNPIADEDLAEVVADGVADGAPSCTVGGPESLPRRDFGALAFAALGKSPRFFRVPIPLALGLAFLLRPFLPRIAQIIPFIIRVSTTECVGEARGTRTLRAHFESLAQRPR